MLTLVLYVIAVYLFWRFVIGIITSWAE